MFCLYLHIKLKQRDDTIRNFNARKPNRNDASIV